MGDCQEEGRKIIKGQLMPGLQVMTHVVRRKGSQFSGEEKQAAI